MLYYELDANIMLEMVYILYRRISLSELNIKVIYPLPQELAVYKRMLDPIIIS